MPLSFLPRLITDSLTDVTPEFLRSRDIRLLMLDFDNTIVPYTTNIPTAKMQQWLQDMTASDITLCVVSNSRNDRVQRFCAGYGIPCIIRAKKPSTKGIREALAKFSVSPVNAAIAVSFGLGDRAEAIGRSTQAAAIASAESPTEKKPQIT